MEDFRMKLQSEATKVAQQINDGASLTDEEIKILFLSTFISEEENEQ